MGQCIEQCTTLELLTKTKCLHKFSINILFVYFVIFFFRKYRETITRRNVALFSEIQINQMELVKMGNDESRIFERNTSQFSPLNKIILLKINFCK